MARGRYQPGPLSDALRQLVAFAEQQRDTPPTLPAAMKQADPLLRAILPPVSAAVGALRPEQVTPLQAQLLLFLRVLCAHPKTRHELVALPVRASITPLTGEAPLDPVTRRAGRPRLGWRFYIGTHPENPAEAGHALRFQAAALLLAVGQDRLQFCDAPDCQRLFIKTGIQKFCSPQCQRRVFLKGDGGSRTAYNPAGAVARRKDRHAKTTTRKRRRQHH